MLLRALVALFALGLVSSCANDTEADNEATSPATTDPPATTSDPPVTTPRPPVWEADAEALTGQVDAWHADVETWGQSDPSDDNCRAFLGDQANTELGEACAGEIAVAWQHRQEADRLQQEVDEFSETYGSDVEDIVGRLDARLAGADTQIDEFVEAWHSADGYHTTQALAVHGIATDLESLGAEIPDLPAIQAEVDAAIPEVCAIAEERYKTTVASLTVEAWQTHWEHVTSRDDMTTAVAECSAEARQAAEAAEAEWTAAVDALHSETEQLVKTVDETIRMHNAAMTGILDNQALQDVAARSRQHQHDAGSFEARATELAADPRASGSILVTSGSKLALALDVLLPGVDAKAREMLEQIDQRNAMLADCQTIDVDQVMKNPNAFSGLCHTMYVRVTYFGTNLGKCEFMGQMSSRRSTRWYDYGGNALLGAPTGHCPDLDTIDENDYVKIWGTGGGEWQYETVAGNTAKAARFVIEKIELVKKD